MILAGCPAEICKKCGKPKNRIYKIIYISERDNTGRTHSLPEQRRGRALHRRKVGKHGRSL